MGMHTNQKNRQNPLKNHTQHTSRQLRTSKNERNNRHARMEATNPSKEKLKQQIKLIPITSTKTTEIANII